MSYSVFDIQCRVTSLGFPCGALDGDLGPRSKAAIQAALLSRGHGAMATADKLFHPSGLHRIVMHWTAGAYGTISLELNAYHALVLEDGEVVYGFRKPEANRDTSDGHYCAHTLGLNTGSIGVAFDAMGGARESPFDPGRHPITEAAVRGMVEEVAAMACTYDIPIHPVSILTHAEVQSTLGRRQNSKWDVTWLPGFSGPKPAREVGDHLRDLILLAF